MSKLTYVRNTTYSMTHTYQKNGVNSSDGKTLLFTVKQQQSDADASDSTAIIKKTVTMNGPVTTITINPLDVPDTVADGQYFYDFKIQESAGPPIVQYQGDNGVFTLVAYPTNRQS